MPSATGPPPTTLAKAEPIGILALVWAHPRYYPSSHEPGFPPL